MLLLRGERGLGLSLPLDRLRLNGLRLDRLRRLLLRRQLLLRRLLLSMLLRLLLLGAYGPDRQGSVGPARTARIATGAQRPERDRAVGRLLTARGKCGPGGLLPGGQFGTARVRHRFGGTGLLGAGRGRGLRRGTRVRAAPGDPAVAFAAEAALPRGVGLPGGRGFLTAVVPGLLVEEDRTGLLDLRDGGYAGGPAYGRERRGGRDGRGRRAAGRHRHGLAAVLGCGTARAGHPGSAVPVPHVSRNGWVRVVAGRGAAVAGCRGWGAHHRGPVSP